MLPCQHEYTQPSPHQTPYQPLQDETGSLDKLERARAAREALAHRHGDTAGARTALDRATTCANTAKEHLSQVLATQQAMIDRRRAGQLAKASGGKAGPGRPPLPLDRAPAVIAARCAVERADRALHRAEADRHKGAVPKANTTDPRSRTMPAKTGGGYLQAYNLQALASRRQIIVAMLLHDNPVDVAALHPLLKAARINLDAAGITEGIGKGLFDAGYASTENFTAPTEVDLYVAVHNGAAQSGGEPTTGKTVPDGWQPMADHMATDQAKQLYKLRSGTIEPVFAQLFNRLGRHLNYRGDMVETELGLWGLTHNLLKHLRHAARTVVRETTLHPTPSAA
ncbi:hypothetical protein [Streptacidiphilus sp. PAMC 29251]